MIKIVNKIAGKISLWIESTRCRLYPTPTQESKMLDTLGVCRRLYNHFVSESRLAFQEGYRVTHDELSAIIPDLIKEWQSFIYSKVAQPVIDQYFHNISVLNALKKKGRKIGKLRFKSREQFKSFTYSQSGFSLGDNQLRLSKIGEIDIVLRRKIEGLIKEVRIKRESSGKWFAIIVSETQKSIKPKQLSITPNRIVGIDVGIINFPYDSDGKVVKNPSILKKSAKKLAKAQRIFSRRVEGSHNRQKQGIKVARRYEKIVNQRKDFLHKQSRYYVDNYDAMFVEDLKIDNMVRNKHLSKAIYDLSLSTFFDMIEYKAESADTPKIFDKVTAYGTSQKCSECGETVKKTLAIRTHRCSNCGLEIDRDYNASLNIKQLGLSNLPQELREVTPVEIEPLRNPKRILFSASSVVGRKQEKLLQNVGGHSVRAIEEDDIKRRYPEQWRLYKTLPLQFRVSDSFNGCHEPITLSTASRLVEYLDSKEFLHVLRYLDIMKPSTCIMSAHI